MATLVLLDRRPLQFPPFLRRHGVGEACSLFEASPCDPATTVDVPFFHVVFFPSSFWPLALRRKGGIVVDWCSGRTKRSARSQGGHPSPPRSSSPSIPPFLRRHGAWEACALLEPSPCEPVDTFDLFYFFHLVFFPSSFRSLALRRKGGTVVGWCSGRTKSSASSRGGHPSPSRSLFHAFPPHFARAWGSGILFSVGASSFEGGRHLCISFLPCVFPPFGPWPCICCWGVPLFSVVADISVIRGNDSRQRISRLLLR